MTPPAGGLARRLAANTLHAASGRVVALAAWLVLTPFIFRGLTHEQFGVWSLFFALTGYLGSLDLGLAQVTLRYSAAATARGDDGEAGEFATLAVMGYATLALVWLLVTPVATEPLLAFLRIPAEVRDGAQFALFMGPVVFGLVGLTNVTLSLLQGHGRFDLANVVNVASAIAQVSGILLALRLGRGLEGVLVATAAGWGLAFTTGMAMLRPAAPRFRWASPVRALRRLREALRFGGPMQFANTIAVLHQQVDKVVLTRVGALAVVGPYELGLRVSTAAAVVPYLMLLALLPEASRLHAHGEHARLRELFERTNRYVLAATAMMTAALWAAADRLFRAWLGEPQEAGVLALRGLTLALAFALSAGAASSMARAIARTDLEAEYSTVAFLVHIACAAWLVPRYELLGALASLCLGNFLAGTWFLSRLGGVLGWPRAALLLRPLGVPLVAAALGVAAGLLLSRVMPLWGGSMGWVGVSAVAATASGVALSVVLGVRFVPPAEARQLLQGALRRVPRIDAPGGAA